MTKEKIKEIKWRKLDNTANIYPVISGNNLSGVYRISFVLNENIQPEKLEEAVAKVVPWFEGFHVRLRRGVFWYYFETNKKLPRVKKEYMYPCRYIDPYRNNQYPFRINYFENKINVEVFHALTDGYGAINFMKELVVQYLRLAHPDEFAHEQEGPLPQTSFELEDSYVKYYKKMDVKGYSNVKAYAMKDLLLTPPVMGVTHGYIDIVTLKMVCKRHQVSITQYLAAVLVYSIYQEYYRNRPTDNAIRINIPVNLRQFFESATTMNFFGVIFAEMKFEDRDYTFEEVLKHVSRNFSDQLTREHMEKLISYNVSNEKHPLLRMIPLFIKNFGIKFIYWRSSKGFTTTLSNLGLIKLPDEYESYVEDVHLIMGVSEKQPVKCVVSSYRDHLTFTFSSVFTDNRLQMNFFNKIAEDGVKLSIDGNGVYEKDSEMNEPQNMPGENRMQHDGLLREKRIPYPDIQFDVHKYHIVTRFFMILSIMLGILMVQINYLTSHEVWWSLISVGAIIYFWITLLFSIKNNTNPAAKIMVQTLGAMVLCILIDVGIGYQGWSVNYAIPAIILIANCATLVLMIVNFMNWQSYILFQIEYAVFSFVPLLLYYLDVIHKPLLTFVAIGTSWVIFLGTIIFGDKKAKNELKRRFHI